MVKAEGRWQPLDEALADALRSFARQLRDAQVRRFLALLYVSRLTFPLQVVHRYDMETQVSEPLSCARTSFYDVLAGARGRDVPRRKLLPPNSNQRAGGAHRHARVRGGHAHDARRRGEARRRGTFRPVAAGASALRPVRDRRVARGRRSKCAIGSFRGYFRQRRPGGAVQIYSPLK